MRSLTDAEARVLTALVADVPEGERDRLRRIALPRSTYHAARRRCYAESWVLDRYVPDPVAFGFPWVAFLAARPFADRIREFVKMLSDHPAAVVVASSPQFLLGVAWAESERAAREFVDSPTKNGLAGWSYGVVSDARSGSIPVYFDYEGAWSHVAGAMGTTDYPRGLGGNPPGENDPGPSSRRTSWAALELVHRPFAAEAEGRPGHVIGTFGLPWSQRRLLEAGTVRHRVLLDAGRIPPYQGRAAGQLVAITGTLKEGHSAGALLATLTQASRVFPLLMASGSGRLIILALGQAAGPSSHSFPRDAERQPPMSRLRDALEGIEILQDSVTSISPWVNHRYDRLLPPRGSG
ncbi:MAG: hypothetical protein L3K23_03930 [Thermoplasmata archaeon]|nr:hypothetical protein [Thermoplasmata archaeon]